MQEKTKEAVRYAVNEEKEEEEGKKKTIICHKRGY